jgi:hypothetical protein
VWKECTEENRQAGNVLLSKCLVHSAVDCSAASRNELFTQHRKHDRTFFHTDTFCEYRGQRSPLHLWSTLMAACSNLTGIPSKLHAPACRGHVPTQAHLEDCDHLEVCAGKVLLENTTIQLRIIWDQIPNRRQANGFRNHFRTFRNFL